MESSLQTINRYPFAKLFPIIPEISRFISIKTCRIVQSWTDAINQDNIDAMYSIALFINYFKEFELACNLPQNQMKVFGTIRSDIFIMHTLSKLTKNNNIKNKKVAMILVQILSFFYTKFKRNRDVVDYIDHLSAAIDAIQKLILLIGHTRIYDPKILENCSQYQFAKTAIKTFLTLIKSYNETKQKIKSKLFPIQPQIQHTFMYICSQKILDILMSTLLYLKVDFLKYFQFYYQEELKDIKIQQLKKNQKEIIQNKGLKESIHKNQTSFYQYLNLLLRQSSQGMTNHKLLFAHIRPLLYYTPSMLLGFKQGKQRQFVFKKIFIKSINFLNKLLDKEKQQYQPEQTIIRFNCQRDFVRAFRASNLLNDIQIALIGFQQAQIKEHKGIYEYQEEYEQVLEYFRELVNVKNKVIETIEQINHRFLQQWPEKNILLKEINDLLPQYQKISEEKPKQNIQIKKSPTTQLSTLGNNKKVNKKKKKGKGLDQIIQSNEEDEYTIYQNDQSKQRIDQFVLQNNSSKETNQGQDIEGALINIKPLQNIRQKNKKDGKKQQKNVPQTKKQLVSTRDERKPSGNNSKSESISTISLSNIKNNPYLLDRLTFIAYYQHHYHPYQSMEIFRQSQNSYLHSNRNIQFDIYSGQKQIIYPDIINTKVYKIKEYSSVDSKKLHIYEKFIENQLPKINQQLKSKRSQLTLITQQINEKQKAMRKSGKNTKQVQSVKKLIFQQFQLQKQIIRIRSQIKIKQVSNGLIIIQLFPLTQTIIGKITLTGLTQCLQIWMRLVDLKRRKKNGLSLEKSNQNILRSNKQLQNPFNHKIFQLMNPYDVQISRFKDNQIIDYFFALVYDFLVVLFQGQSDYEINSSFKQFHSMFFSRLDLSHKAILLYYIYEMDGQQHFKFTCLIQKLVSQFIPKGQIEEILRFLILDLKLQGQQMNRIYMKLYSILSQNCFMTLSVVVDTFLHDIIPLTKDINIKKNFNNSSQMRNKPDNEKKLKDLQRLKNNFYNQFDMLVDMMQIWTIITFGVNRPQVSVKSPETIKNLQANLLFYCPYCSSLIFIKYSHSNPYNYQEPFCDNCSNSLLHRFQLELPSCEFILFANKMKYKMGYLLFEYIMKLERAIEQNKWYIEEATNGKYLNQQSLFKKIFSQQNKQETVLNKNLKQKSIQKSLSSTHNLSSGKKDESFQQRIIRIHNKQKSHNKPEKGNKNRSNNLISLNSNTTMSNNNKPNNRNLSGNKYIHSQRKQTQSIENNRNFKLQLNQNQQQPSLKQIIDQNHQYCFNMERILKCYLIYIDSLISKN